MQGIWARGFMGELGLAWHESWQKAREFNLAGYNDWRIPNIQELLRRPNASLSWKIHWSATIDISNPQKAWIRRGYRIVLPATDKAPKGNGYFLSFVRDRK